MKGVKRFFVAFLIFILVAVGVLWFRYKKVIDHPLIVDTDSVTINVSLGMTFYSLLDTLVEDNIVKDKNLIKLAIKYNELPTEIKAGQYTLDSTLSLEQLLKELQTGTISNNTIKVTIPEGYDIETIATLLEGKGIVSSQTFLNACLEYKIPDSLVMNENDNVKYKIEGYLFPDTYNFEKHTSPDVIINKMINRFMAVLTELEKDYGKKIANLDEIVTMASIVEKEARVAEDRPIIASVFNNRIEKGQMLQSCATVIYALGEYKEKLLLTDLEVNSPYNSYKNLGLPPGPICNPGKASLIAALYPADTDYIYFVAKGDGSHYFSNNYNDFLEAKNKYLK
ncbi:endolytic transglycosylase MltG [Clostridium grantii]|uniref:Endolytic murein transglycosylase n=1 Tax=Clostridium grantii DSM 8605 TaxID=1121316 RepID=A0A1M5QRV3_9CLOT|nr:endolytic transglycosylase MltG [Clostridium grantii]SHH16611.1 UPF0755 protein [Clostridium grantii DSM 8605]